MKDSVPNPITTSVVLAAAALTVGFFVGMKYQSAKMPAFTRQGGGSQTMMFRNGGVQGGMRIQQNRPIAGSVISADDTSITVKFQDGSSKIVLITKSTQINKASAATKEDVTTGMTVAVFGQQNSDGSVTAHTVQLNPSFVVGGTGMPAKRDSN